MMRIRIDDRTVEAKLDSKYADTSHGHAMLVVDGDVLIEPSFASLHDYRIVEATRAERAMLIAAGYDMLDFIEAD